MDATPKHLPADPLREGALAVVRTLRAAGHQALFAGGCVRDRVLGLVPKDYDVATDARPDQVISLFERSIPVGVQFGVVRVIVEHREYEVATFRAEADYRDGRRPSEVRWADARADVLRRDFTINGLLEDPLAPGGGEVLDFVGGEADLRAGIVRAIGDPEARFLEDHLRLIRCVRFAARMGFTIDAPTWQAVRALAPRITKVSPERIGDELDRIVSQGHQARGFELLERSGLAAHVLPEVATPERAAAAEARLGHLGACDPHLGWGALLLDVPDSVEPIGERLRWSRTRLRDVSEVVGAAARIGRWDTLGLAERKRCARRRTFGAALVVAGAAGGIAQEHAAREEARGWSEGDLDPRPLLTGDDLIRAGHRPGPSFKAALEALETAQLEGRAETVAEAWEVVRSAL